MSYDNNMTGAMFKNDKGDNPKRPDMRGSIEIDGAKYWLSGWSRIAEKGKYAGQKFLSLKVQRDEKQDAPPAARHAAAPSVDANGDDVLPF